VVVKRLKEVSVGKRDFEQQMEVVGSIRHENVVELKAYYYSKDEKLMVYDYFSQGSVASMLHGMLPFFNILFFCLYSWSSIMLAISKTAKIKCQYL
jgi:hypothetical protein